MARGLAAAQAAALAVAESTREIVAPAEPAALIAGPHRRRRGVRRHPLRHAARRRLPARASPAIRDVVLPVLVEIGARWERDELSVGHEHFASHLLERRLLGMARGWEAGPRPARPARLPARRAPHARPRLLRPRARRPRLADRLPRRRHAARPDRRDERVAEPGRRRALLAGPAAADGRRRRDRRARSPPPHDPRRPRRDRRAGRAARRPPRRRAIRWPRRRRSPSDRRRRRLPRPAPETARSSGALEQREPVRLGQLAPPASGPSRPRSRPLSTSRYVAGRQVDRDPVAGAAQRDDDDDLAAAPG